MSKKSLKISRGNKRPYVLDKFEDTKEVIRGRMSKKNLKISKR
jgi:hypothetical protein